MRKFHRRARERQTRIGLFEVCHRLKNPMNILLLRRKLYVQRVYFTRWIDLKEYLDILASGRYFYCTCYILFRRGLNPEQLGYGTLTTVLYTVVSLQLTISIYWMVSFQKYCLHTVHSTTHAYLQEIQSKYMLLLCLWWFFTSQATVLFYTSYASLATNYITTISRRFVSINRTIIITQYHSARTKYLLYTCS